MSTYVKHDNLNGYCTAEPQGHMSFDLSDRYTYNGDMAAMMKDVSAITAGLVKNGYTVLFYLDDCDIYILEYCHNENKGYGSDCIMIVTDEEREDILSRRETEAAEIERKMREKGEK